MNYLNSNHSIFKDAKTSVTSRKRSWFTQKFTYSPGEVISLDEIMKEFSADKENLHFNLQRSDVSLCLRQLYGDRFKTVKPRREGGKKDKLYLNIRKVNSESGIYGWILRESSTNPPHQKYSKFVGVFINGNEAVFQLEVNPDSLDYTLTTPSGKEVHGNDICLTSDFQNLSALLLYLSKYTLCRGIESNDFYCSVVKKKEDPLCSAIKINGGSRYIARKCCQLVLVEGEMCSECTYVKKLLDKRKPDYANIIKTKNTLLGEEQMRAKMTELVRLKRNAAKRESYWRAKFEEGSFVVSDEDNADFSAMLDKVDSTKMNEDMRLLLEQQGMALQRKSKQGYRWHPKIIRLCLDIYSTSPKAFQTMKQHLILPSKRLVRYYKNSVSQSSGWNSEVINWCYKEATRLQLSESDVWGGLVFDEMTVQEDLEFVKVGGKKQLVGAVSLGRSYDDMRYLVEGKNEPELASKVMQFAIVTDCGFRFALAHFPVKSMPAVTLLEKFWEGVEHCERAGFRIYWVLCDGGEPNRSFIKLLFPYGSDPAEHNFTAKHVHNGGDMVAAADCKHIFKKIRNHLEKSTLADNAKRQLTVNNSKIVFKFWKDAFQWDQQSHSLPIHEQLTDAHFELNPRSKMRNHLAEDVLDEKMLLLMEKYKNHLFNKGKQGEAAALDEPIRFLQFTSHLINLFSRKDPIYSIGDVRVQKAKEFLEYLNQWKENAESPKEFLSDKLWFDIRSMIIGLEKIIEIKSSHYPGNGIKPAIINQDVLENIFCQVRGSNGQNDHPKYYMYSSTLISVNVGQTVISKKGNASQNKHALPHAGLPVDHPFAKKKRS